MRTLAIVVMKDLFDGQSEEPGGPEGQRQTWIEFARLDGVDGLPGDIEGVGQLGLGPIALGAQHLKSIFHRYRRVPYIIDTRNVSPITMTRYAMSALKGITWYVSITDDGMPTMRPTPTVVARAFR